MGRLHASDEYCEHEGFVVGYVPRHWWPAPINGVAGWPVADLGRYTSRGVLREVGTLQLERDSKVRGICVIGVGCSCGWRSPYYEVGTPVEWSPCSMHAPDWLEDRLSAKWWTPHVEQALRLEPERAPDPLVGTWTHRQRTLAAAPKASPEPRAAIERLPVEEWHSHDHAICDCLDCENWRRAEDSHAEASTSPARIELEAPDPAALLELLETTVRALRAPAAPEPRGGVRIELDLEPAAAAALLELIDQLGPTDLNWLLAREAGRARRDYAECTLDPMAPIVDDAGHAIDQLDNALRLALRPADAQS